MLYLQVVILAAGVLACQCASVPAGKAQLKQSDDVLENHIPASFEGDNAFVKIMDGLPAIVYQNNSAVQLECEFMGAPAASVQWLMNDLPILEHEVQSTVESSDTSMGHGVSRLLVEPSDDVSRRYSCLVTAGHKNAVASTTVINTGKGSDLSERQSLNPMRPRIMGWSIVLIDVFGATIVLPCRATGHPKPMITWYGEDGHAISGDDNVKILHTGELIITNLQWSDMGLYKCQAENGFGADSATTFLYPVPKPRNSH